MMGLRWPQEEWKPNTVELEVRAVFDKRKCSNQEQFLYRQWIFNMLFLLDVFTLFIERKFSKKGQFFSRYDEFRK